MGETAPQLPSIDSLPGRSLGGYVVKQRLFEGGMGMVYLAEHQTIGRRAAVKFLKPEAANDAEWTARFLTEARALAALKHRNLVEVFEFGATPDGFQYLMMEFIEGTSLENYLVEQDSKGQLPLAPALALKFAEQILNGLGEAHKKGVVHRDLKPANVMKVREHSGEVLLKIVDFGLARQDPVDLLRDDAPRAHLSSLLAGTPEYIAPEQARGLRGDGRADLYALGVMLYEMLAGHLPFKSESVMELMKKHAFEQPPSLAEAVPGLPEGVGEFVHQLLEKEPDRRPASADVARQAVHRLLKGLERESTTIKPMPSKFSETAKIDRVIGPTSEELVARAMPSRGNQKAVAAAAVIAVLLLIWFLRPGAPPVAVVAPVVAPPVEAARVVEPPPAGVIEPPVEEPAVEVAPLDPKQPARPVAPKPPALGARHVELARPWFGMAVGCTPDTRWREDAMRTLRELGEIAAADPQKWKEYQRREGALTQAIRSANQQLECGLASKQIGDLTDAVLRN